MAVVWTLNVPDAGTGRVFSIEDRIWDRQRTSVSTAVGRMLGASRAVPQQVRTRGGRFGEDLIAALRQMHFRARNAPYTSDDLSNPLKLQQMRPPSERTKYTKSVDAKNVFAILPLPRCYSGFDHERTATCRQLVRPALRNPSRKCSRSVGSRYLSARARARSRVFAGAASPFAFN
jgi:hypothetical protein